MLRIRSAPLRVFEEEAWQRFDDEMVVHGQDFSPRLCEVIGEEQLRVAIRRAIRTAVGYGSPIAARFASSSN